MGHPRFAQLLMKIQELHDTRTDQYNPAGDPLGNWKLVIPLMRPWKGCYSRVTEKFARLQQVVNRPIVDPHDMWEALRDLATYCIMTEILFEEDVEAKS